MDAIKSASLRVVRATQKTQWVFVVLETRHGLRGYGEATRPGMEMALVDAAKTVIPSVARASLITPGSFARAASVHAIPEAAIVSAIDHALWDLYAQACGVRLAEALGMIQRDLIPVYANFNRRTEDRSSAGFAASASIALRAGFNAFKLAPFDEVTAQVCEQGGGQEAMRLGLARVRAVKDVLEPNVRLMIDCHWRFDEVTAAQLIDEAAKLGLYWVECPLPERPENIDALVRLRRRANDQGMRLAGLEDGIGIDSIRPFVVAGAYDVVMPDVKYFGGLESLLQANEWLSQHGTEMSLHNPSGPVCHAVSMNVSAAIAKIDRLELQFDESPLFDSLVGGALPKVDRGSAPLPSRSGNGISLDEAQLQAYTDFSAQWTFN